MKTDEIKNLIELLENSSLNSMEVWQGDSKVILSKGNAAMGSQAGALSNQQPFGVGTCSNQQSEKQSPNNDGNSDSECGGKNGNSNGFVNASQTHIGTPMKSPMVGVFYQSGTPSQPPFVAVGQKIKKGQTLCVIEAMKLMNEITADADGEVTEICVTDGQVVEFGQPILYVK